MAKQDTEPKRVILEQVEFPVPISTMSDKLALQDGDILELRTKGTMYDTGKVVHASAYRKEFGGFTGVEPTVKP